MTKYALYPGCLIPYRLPSIEFSARFVAEKLDMELLDLPGHTCCPDPVSTPFVDNELWMMLACRNVSLAEENDMEMAVLCSGCYESLYEAYHRVKSDPEELKRINDVLAKFERNIKGTSNVKHIVEVLMEVLEKNTPDNPPLEGLKLAVHYGCHLYRGGNKKDKKMAILAKMTGAEIIYYGLENLCCGFPATQVDEKFGYTQRLLPKVKKISESGADLILTVCPACTIQFETGQMLLKKYGEDYSIPAIHLLELIALWLGADPDNMGLELHRSKLKKVIQDKLK